MNWERYKAICDTPDVCSRWLLEQTLELVAEPSLAGRLRAHLDGTPLEKPDDHEGGPETDMFRMSLGLDDVRALRRRLEEAVAAGATTSGTRDRGLNGFIETWQEYERYLEHRGGGGSRGG